MGAPEFINGTIVFHVWFAAVGTFLFVRRGLARPATAATLAAVVFAFGGQLISKEQFPNMLQAASYLPWALWMTRRLVTRRRVRDALGLGLVLGLQLLAAHAQMAMLTLYLSAAYGVRLLLARRPEARALWRLAGMTLLAAAAAAGLAAGQLLPTAELYRDALRQRLSFSVVDRFYLPGNQLGNFVLPALHGHPLAGDYTARGNFWETCCFVGAIALTLALVGVVAAFRRTDGDDGRFWSGAALVGLLMACGGQTWRGTRAAGGLYWMAYHILPGFRSFHDPARCLLWCCFALAILAASGLASLGGPRRPWLRSLPCHALLIAGCFAELLHFGRGVYPLAARAALHPVPPLVALLRSSPAFQEHQARFLAPDTSRVWQRFTAYRSYRQTVPNYQSLWADTLTPNLMVDYGLADASGYEPVSRRDVQTIAQTMGRTFSAAAEPWERADAAPLAGVFSVRDIALLRVRAPQTVIPGLLPVAAETTLPSLGKTQDSARLSLSRNALWQPRARLMTDFRAVDTPAQALSLMADSLVPPRPFDLDSTLILTGRVSFPSAPGTPLPATITQDDPDRVAVAAQTTGPTVLVLADALHPGWRVAVNGRPAPLLTAYYCLRAVPLPRAGRCRVVFTDRPTSFVLGLYVTLLTVGMFCGSSAFALTSRRKKSTARQESGA